jgi:hypothetical protein
MRRPLLALALLLAGPALADPVRLAALVDPALAPPPRPDRAAVAQAPDPDIRCTRDKAACIARSTYIPDVCRTIEAAARAHGIDRGFFARLLWKESLFDAAAVSPAGAQGIAQFMPGTAKLRGLDDAFNPAEALYASAAYLADLSRTYGNLGLAAAAYNGGEARADRFVAGTGGLPDETRAYVAAITGHSAESWRDAPPATVDLALEGDDFQAACLTLAANRSLREFRSEPALMPWGVVVAMNRDGTAAERQVARLKNRHAGVLGGETVSYTRARRPGLPGRFTYAQVGRGSRGDADALCARLRGDGGDCMVLKN